MRILLYTLNYRPELTGTGKYAGEMSAWLQAHGHEVRVVTTPPYYPAWAVAAGHRSWLYRREREGGARVIRCPLWVPRRQSGGKRLLHLLSFALSSLPVVAWQGWRWRPDVVFLVAPTLFCVPGSRLSAWLAGAVTWLHVQDFEVDAAFQLGLLAGERRRRLVVAQEARWLRSFDRVTTISERMLERLTAKGVPAARQGLFPNWVDTRRIRPRSEPSPYRAAWGIGTDEVVVLYSGNMGEKQGLEVVLAAAERLRDQTQVRFVLCGEGAARSRLMARAATLTNVRFQPLQPEASLNELLNLADIHLLPQREDAADLVMPSKLTGIFASGRPVIATAHPDTQVGRLITACGKLTPPGDAIRLSEAIAELADHPDLRRELGERGRRHACESWDMERVLASFAAELERLHQASRPAAPL